AGVPVLGHYKYDDQGVPARPVTLVKDGRLKTLVMSRNPSKEFKNSTGHGRGSHRVSTSTGCLVISADQGLDEAALKTELLEACADEDLEYGIRVASLAGSMRSGGFSPYGFGGDFDMFSGRRRGSGTDPLVMYKVFPDGREELVRGAEFAEIDLKAFKRILAAGDKPYVLNTGGTTGRTVAVPALLFEELDLAKIDRDFDKPPILPTPLARGPEE
ncbi:MAG: metallopeptidase TldD-related protein, partial [Planctomycetota bacterium]